MKKLFKLSIPLLISISSAFSGIGASTPLEEKTLDDNLFVMQIGGEREGCHTESHDIRFAISETIEGTYDDLRANWTGKANTLHLDCWGPLKWVDGYRVEIKNVPFEWPEKLFFVELGGYKDGIFGEQHANVFIVSNSERDARGKAKNNHMPSDWIHLTGHLDFIFDVDGVIDVASAVNRDGKYIHLIKDANCQPFTFKCKYTPIGS